MGLTLEHRGRGLGGDPPCPASALESLAEYLALGLPPTRADVETIGRAAGEIRRLRGLVEGRGGVGGMGMVHGSSDEADRLIERFNRDFG